MKFLEWYGAVKESATAYDRHYREIAAHLFFGEYGGDLRRVHAMKATDVPIHVQRACQMIGGNYNRETSMNAFRIMEMAQSFYKNKTEEDYEEELSPESMIQSFEKEQETVGSVPNDPLNDKGTPVAPKAEVSTRENAGFLDGFKKHAVLLMYYDGQDVQKISQKTGLTPEQIEEIVRTQAKASKEAASSGIESFAEQTEKKEGSSLDSAWNQANGDMNVYRKLGYQEGFNDEQIEDFVLQKVKAGLAKQQAQEVDPSLRDPNYMSGTTKATRGSGSRWM